MWGPRTLRWSSSATLEAYTRNLVHRSTTLPAPRRHTLDAHSPRFFSVGSALYDCDRPRKLTPEQNRRNVLCLCACVVILLPRCPVSLSLSHCLSFSLSICWCTTTTSTTVAAAAAPATAAHREQVAVLRRTPNKCKRLVIVVLYMSLSSIVSNYFKTTCKQQLFWVMAVCSLTVSVCPLCLLLLDTTTVRNCEHKRLMKLGLPSSVCVTYCNLLWFLLL